MTLPTGRFGDEDVAPFERKRREDVEVFRFRQELDEALPS